MPPESKAAGSKGPAEIGVADRLSALSDNALRRVLSFLPPADAVRTRFLARQWRDRWKDVGCLRITDADDYRSANELNMFANMFLLFSNPRPLHEVEISSYRGRDSEESLRYLELWVRNCLQREARILKVRNTVRRYWQLDQGLLSSKHLRVLDLLHVKIKGVLNNLKICCLDFSSCEALEDLVMNNCGIEATLIKSPSLKRLTLKCCCFRRAARARISVPKLVFLMLASCEGRNPIIEKMPCLESAFVRLQADMDCCRNNYETSGCNSCVGCHHCIIERNTSVLLEALSGATHVELTST